MTVTYTAGSSTDRNRIRFAINDTVSGAGPKPDGGNFSDAEIDLLIADASAAGQTWRSVVGRLLRFLANQYAIAARAESIGSVSQNLSGTAAELRRQAADWEAQIDSSGNEIGAMGAGQLLYTGMHYTVNEDGTVT